MTPATKGLHVYFRPEETRAIEEMQAEYGVSKSSIVRYALRLFVGLSVPSRFMQAEPPAAGGAAEFGKQRGEC